ncbi:hypothetical protein BJ322DRAFT_147481 [Thelephora terrestris]|uniref:Uncharacterized protein n=1 Tax=Thelephora terrestris TaxID=56493 RepID=A0A9P6HBT8_9AGAM|nr:hypothetical protein BJ322DRAFT_147481 [Thelephora terrestris]
MDPKQVEVLANVGRQLLTAKVAYAWTGRKSWVFALFIANRYLPALHIIYKGLILFDFTKSLCVSSLLRVTSTVSILILLVNPHSCERTKWEVNLFTASVAVLAQTTIAIRLYAVTGRSKVHACVLCALILGQLAIGLALAIVSGIRPLNPLPPINLDAFKICSFNQWRPGEFGFVIVAVSFGTPSYPPPTSDTMSTAPYHLVDLFAFTMIYVAARGPRLRGYPGIPNLLKGILQDATKYFFLMAACQIVLLFFLILAPVRCISGGLQWGAHLYISVGGSSRLRVCVFYSHRSSSYQG